MKLRTVAMALGVGVFSAFEAYVLHASSTVPSEVYCNSFTPSLDDGWDEFVDETRRSQECWARRNQLLEWSERLQRAKPAVVFSSGALFAMGVAAAARARRWWARPVAWLRSSVARERIVLVTFASLVCALALFPPWTRTRQIAGTSQATQPLNHQFIFDPPVERRESDRELVGVRIDAGRFLVELLFLVVASSSILLLVRSLRRQPTERQTEQPPESRSGSAPSAEAIAAPAPVGVRENRRTLTFSAPRIPPSASYPTGKRAPREDPVARHLIQQASEDAVSVYAAQIPTRLLGQSDDAFSPEESEEGQAAVDQAMEQIAEGEPPTLWVYPRGKSYVVPFHYAEYSAALLLEVENLNCWVLGRRRLAAVTVFEGPIPVSVVRRSLNREGS